MEVFLEKQPNRSYKYYCPNELNKIVKTFNNKKNKLYTTKHSTKFFHQLIKLTISDSNLFNIITQKNIGSNNLIFFSYIHCIHPLYLTTYYNNIIQIIDKILTDNIFIDHFKSNRFQYKLKFEISQYPIYSRFLFTDKFYCDISIDNKYYNISFLHFNSKFYLERIYFILNAIKILFSKNLKLLILPEIIKEIYKTFNIMPEI